MVLEGSPECVYIGGGNGSKAMIRFNFDESKAVETLVYVSRAWPDITPFYLSKILFFADRQALRDVAESTDEKSK
jgi:hypothetical protein